MQAGRWLGFGLGGDGQAANWQPGSVRPTALPSGQSFASSVQAVWADALLSVSAASTSKLQAMTKAWMPLLNRAPIMPDRRTFGLRSKVLVPTHCRHKATGL